MARIMEMRLEEADDFAAKVFEAQAKRWGAPLLNHQIYARRPSILRGVRAMWGALSASGLVDAGLQTLLNRRVASHNGCEF
ncbi:MAG: hypothetical protein ACKVX9_17745 [Blastocatellia bacterium]